MGRPTPGHYDDVFISKFKKILHSSFGKTKSASPTTSSSEGDASPAPIDLRLEFEKFVGDLDTKDPFVNSIIDVLVMELNRRREAKSYSLFDARQRSHHSSSPLPGMFNETASALRSLIQSATRIYSGDGFPALMLDPDASTPVPYSGADPEDYFDQSIFAEPSYRRRPMSQSRRALDSSDDVYLPRGRLNLPPLRSNGIRGGDFGADPRSPQLDGLDADPELYGGSWMSRYGMSPPPRTVGISYSSPPRVSLPRVEGELVPSVLPPEETRQPTVSALASDPSAIRTHEASTTSPSNPDNLRIVGSSMPSETGPSVATTSTNALSAISGLGVDVDAAMEFEAHAAFRRSARRERNRTDSNLNRERASQLEDYRIGLTRQHAADVGSLTRTAVSTATAEASTPTSSSSASSLRPIHSIPHSRNPRPLHIPPHSSSRSPFDTLSAPFYPSEVSFETLRQRLESYPQYSNRYATNADGTPIGPSSISIRPPHSALVLGGEGRGRQPLEARPPAGEVGRSSFMDTLYGPYTQPYGSVPLRRRRRSSSPITLSPRNETDRHLTDAINRERMDIAREIFGIPNPRPISTPSQPASRNPPSTLDPSGLSEEPRILFRSPSPLPPFDHLDTVPTLSRAGIPHHDSDPPPVVDLALFPEPSGSREATGNTPP